MDWSRFPDFMRVGYELAREQGFDWEPDPEHPGWERHRIADLQLPEASTWGVFVRRPTRAHDLNRSE